MVIPRGTPRERRTSVILMARAPYGGVVWIILVCVLILMAWALLLRVLKLG
jgi:hypothetical protein